MRVELKIEGAAESADALKRVRQQIQRDVRLDMKAAVEEHALPQAKRAAPGRVERLVRAGATSRDAYLEVQARTAAARRLFPGPKGGEVPRLLYYGGQRRDRIVPKNRRAVATPYGPRAAVNRPRRYKPNPFLDPVVARTRPQVVQEILERIDKRYRHQGFTN